MIVSKFANSDNGANLSDILLDTINYVTNQDLDNLEPGRYPVKELDIDDVYFLVLDYETDAETQSGPEFHKTYTDVQFLIRGEEKCGWAIATDQQIKDFSVKYDYSAERDICFIRENDIEMNYLKMQPDEFYIFTPNTIHMPNLDVEATSKVRKIVIKIKTELLV